MELTFPLAGAAILIILNPRADALDFFAESDSMTARPSADIAWGQTKSKPQLLRAQCVKALMPDFNDIKTWTEHLGHSRLRSFTDAEGRFWLEQNASKASKWAKLAREGHEVAWEFDSPGGSYTGRLLIDGEIYTTSEATNKFLKE